MFCECGDGSLWRFFLVSILAGVLLLGALVVWQDSTPNRDPYLSSRTWNVLLLVGAIGFLAVAFTVPNSRSGAMFHIGFYAIVLIVVGWTARGIGRARLLLPALTGTTVTGPAQPTTGDESEELSKTAPFSGRSCLGCLWRVEQQVNAESGDQGTFQIVESGTIDHGVRVGEHTLSLDELQLVDADEETISETEWPEEAVEQMTELTDTFFGSPGPRRAVEQRIVAGQQLTILPGVIYAGDATATQRAFARTVLTRMFGLLLIGVPAGTVVATTTCLPG